MTKEEIKAFKKLIPKGSKVYCILRHVSQSGMMRVIDFYNKDMIRISHKISDLLSYSYHNKKEGLRVTGCGMDMGFAVVYDLSSAIHKSGYHLTREWL